MIIEAIFIGLIVVAFIAGYWLYGNSEKGKKFSAYLSVIVLAVWLLSIFISCTMDVVSCVKKETCSDKK